MDWKVYISKTVYSKDTDRILNAFRVGKIKTFSDLQNAPVRLGPKICGYDIYQFIAALNEVINAEQSADVPLVTEAATASTAKKPLTWATKGTEQSDKQAPAEKDSGSPTKAGADKDKAK